MKSDRSMNSLLARQMQSLGFSLDENEPPALRYAMPPYINAMALCDSCSCMHENGASVIFTGHGGDEGISHRSSPYEMFYHHEYYHFSVLCGPQPMDKKDVFLEHLKPVKTSSDRNAAL